MAGWVDRSTGRQVDRSTGQWERKDKSNFI